MNLEDMSEAFWTAIVVSSVGLVGSLLAAGGALVGVLCALRQNNRLHENNIRVENDRRREDIAIENEKRVEERAFLAKQHAFMQAAEAVVRFTVLFVRLPDAELQVGGAAYPESTELGVALNRLHFYCGVHTIEKIIELQKALAIAFMEALASQLSSGFIGGDIRGLDTQIVGLNQVNASIQQEILALLHSDPKNAY